MNCLFAVLGLIIPRVIAVGWWLADPARWSTVFGGTLLPVLGFLFLPWTTVMVVLSWTSSGFSLLGWIFIFFAFMADIATYGGGFLGNKERVSSYYR